jgi:hypothetical protein
MRDSLAEFVVTDLLTDGREPAEYAGNEPEN